MYPAANRINSITGQNGRVLMFLNGDIVFGCRQWGKRLRRNDKKRHSQSRAKKRTGKAYRCFFIGWKMSSGSGRSRPETSYTELDFSNFQFQDKCIFWLWYMLVACQCFTAQVLLISISSLLIFCRLQFAFWVAM